MDIDSIKPGEDFAQTIEKAIVSCEVVLVLIGPHWLSASDGLGNRRLDNPDDPVRLEIMMALRHKLWVIPLLLDNTSMPSPADFPSDLTPFLLRNALEISNERFEYDIERLVTTLLESQSLAGLRRSLRLSSVSEQRRFRRNWMIVTLLASVWCLVTLILYWSANTNPPDNFLTSLTWAVVLPITYAGLTAFSPITPLDAGFWAFGVHVVYAGLIWGTDAYREYIGVLETTQELSLLNLAVYGGFILIPSILVGLVISLISWVCHRRNRNPPLHST